MSIHFDIKKFIISLYLLSFVYGQFSLPFNRTFPGNKQIDPEEVNELLKEFSSDDDKLQNRSSEIIGPEDKNPLKRTIKAIDSNNLENIVKDQILNNDINSKSPPKNKAKTINNLGSSEKVEDDLFVDKKTVDNIKKQVSDEINESISLKKEKESFFGYNIFSDSDISQFNDPYESIDPNYIIGPGDEIIIMLWGETELFDSFYISKEGFLFIPNIGQVFVNGLTLEKLEKKLFKLLKKSYSSLDPVSGTAKTFFDISLGATTVRPIRVTLLGEVEQAGFKNLNSSLNFFNSLFYFGGPKTSGSLRNVKLIRNDKEISSIDLYQYLLTGKKGKEIRLQRNDVIFFPIKNKSVFVRGEIVRSNMHYELKDKEGLKDLINFAGGIKPRTYLKRVQIVRRLSPEERIKAGFNTTLVDVDITDLFDSNENVVLYDGDEITFLNVDDIVKNYVEIRGPVRMPGRYSIGEKLFLSDLINAAMIKEDAYLKRVDIFRKNKDLTETLITRNLSDILGGEKSVDVELNDLDQIKLYTKRDMMDEKFVEIEGFVKSPGKKSFRAGMTLSDLLFLGGGFENQSHKNNTYFDRAELVTFKEDGFSKKIIPFRLDSALSGGSFSKRLMKNKDKIRIYSKNEIEGLIDNYVEIEGFVKRPGKYPLFNDNMTLYDLLFNAGGIDDTLHLSRMYLERADLIRYDNDYMEKNITRFNLGNVLNEKSLESNFRLKNQDLIRIYSVDQFLLEKTVSIDGIINEPGTYELSKNTTLKDLILEAGGVTENVFRYRAEIARIDPESNDEKSYAEIISVDLNNDLSIFDHQGFLGKSKNKNQFKLENYDIVTLRPDPKFSLQRKVSIEGEVYYPGTYVITSPYEKVSDIINRAGGLRPEGYAKASSLLRNGQLINLSFDRIIKYPNSKYNFEVSGGDILTIGKKTKLVIIKGEVNAPGNYQYVKGYRFNDYVKLAGGYTKDASRTYSFVRHPDGSSKKVKLLRGSLKVIDGSIIEIGKKEELAIDFTEYLNNLTNIMAQITQTLLVISVLQSSI